MIESIYLKDKLNEFIIKAIAVHLAVILLGIILNTVLNLNLFNSKKVNTKLEVVQSAVRVDVVSLPKLTLQELKKIDLTPVPEAIKEPEPVKTNETSKIEFKQKSKKIDLSNLLKNLSSNKIRTKSKKKEKKKQIDRSALKKLILEGNKVSKGSSTTGNEVNSGQKEFISYIQSLPDKVKPYWKLPSYLIDKDLRCRVRLFIASDGRVINMEIFESSGDSEFDKKAMDAVTNSSPLPKPDSFILSKVASGSVILGFPL